MQVGGVLDFPVSRGLLDSVKQSWQKYQNDLAHKKKMAEQEVEKRKEVEELRQKAKQIEQKDKMKQCEEEIQLKEICLGVADDAIQSGNKKLQEALTKKKPIVQSIQLAHKSTLVWKERGSWLVRLKY